MLMAEFFDGIREDLGGSTETTLVERWPDRRLFGYLVRFVRKLAVDIPLAQDPDSGVFRSVPVTAGAALVTLPFEPTRLVRVQVLSPDNSRRVLAPTTQEAILYERDQNPGLSPGTPLAFAVAPLSTGQTGLLLHPPPAQAATLEIWYWPLAAVEPPGWTSEGAIDPTSQDTALVPIPALLIDAAQQWCLWRAMRSAEDFDTREWEMQRQLAEAMYQRALGDYNAMILDQSVIVSPWISPLL